MTVSGFQEDPRSGQLAAREAIPGTISGGRCPSPNPPFFLFGVFLDYYFGDVLVDFHLNGGPHESPGGLRHPIYPIDLYHTCISPLTCEAEAGFAVNTVHRSQYRVHSTVHKEPGAGPASGLTGATPNAVLIIPPFM